MLHKAEEWKVISHAPKIKMMKEHGRHLRQDDDAERKLLAAALALAGVLLVALLWRLVLLLPER